MRVWRLGPIFLGAGEVPRTTYRVYVDESGIRAHGPKTSRHFVMSACIIPDMQKADLLGRLAQLRVDLGQPVGQTIAFKRLSHQSRLHLAQSLGRIPYLTITNVIVCKRELPRAMADVDAAYLYTLRYLLERVSWYVDERGGQAYVTFAHIDRFRIEINFTAGRGDQRQFNAQSVRHVLDDLVMGKDEF